MNTTTAPLRLTAAASAVALAVTLAGWAAGESRPRAASEVVVTSAMHRALVREEADRYVRELLVRARMATEETSAAPSVDVVLTRVSGL